MDQTLQINVYRSSRRLMVATTVPGLEPQDIHIAVDGRQLSVQAVDATRANASYDNGVLVMIFPLAAQPISGTMTLSKVGTAKGQCIRHVGQDLRPRLNS